MINHLQSVKQCQNKQIQTSNYLHSIAQLHCAGIVLIKHTLGNVHMSLLRVRETGTEAC